MNVKGFIIEDDRGRELVVLCEQPYARLAKTFELRGWQRRRMVPLHYTERELRQVVQGVLATLTDLLEHLPAPLRNSAGASSHRASRAASLHKVKKTLLSQEIRKGEKKAEKHIEMSAKQLTV